MFSKTPRDTKSASSNTQILHVYDENHSAIKLQPRWGLLHKRNMGMKVRSSPSKLQYLPDIVAKPFDKVDANGQPSERPPWEVRTRHLPLKTSPQRIWKDLHKELRLCDLQEIVGERRHKKKHKISVARSKLFHFMHPPGSKPPKPTSIGSCRLYWFHTLSLGFEACDFPTFSVCLSHFVFLASFFSSPWNFLATLRLPYLYLLAFSSA